MFSAFWQNMPVMLIAKTAAWLSANAFVSGVEVRGSNLRSVKSKAMLPIALHRYDISVKKGVLSGHNDTEMDPASSLHTSA